MVGILLKKLLGAVGRRRTFTRSVFLFFIAASLPVIAEEQLSTDVLIFGGTPSGIAAALATGRSGYSVVLMEPYSHIGGLTANGLSHTDFHSVEGLSGAFLEFTHRVENYYRTKYGEDSIQLKDCRGGTNGEPHVNQRVFETMLEEVGSVVVRTRHTLTGVSSVGGTDGEISSISSAKFKGPNGNAVAISAGIFIDASYEGDLMAMAGVPYAVGRESKYEYNESLAPEVGDGQVQGYNFRLIVTDDPANRVMPRAPEGYNRNDFLPIVELLTSGQLESVWCASKGGIYKNHRPVLPNRKYDVNDVSRGLVRLSMPDLNDAWPDGDAATRQRIFDAHLRHNVGMLYFLQNDKAVPPAIRAEASTYGWARDEFTGTGHIPEQLYIREARRMIGQHLYNQRDTEYAEGDARAVLHSDAIAIGEYSHNCHGTAHEGPRMGGKHTGEFYLAVPPYQIPYGVIIPRACENLFVPVAVSSTHVGFCALRYEPVWMSLGQAAGTAAAIALDQKIPVQKVDVRELQARLHADHCATIYVGDVNPDSPDFAAVQWWGLQGGLHGLEQPPGGNGPRGKNITSQYFEKYPGHDVQLEKLLTDELRKRWLRIVQPDAAARKLLAETRTRGEFIRTAYSLFNRSNF